MARPACPGSCPDSMNCSMLSQSRSAGWSCFRPSRMKTWASACRSHGAQSRPRTLHRGHSQAGQRTERSVRRPARRFPVKDKDDHHTDNGIHLNAHGYRSLARAVMFHLGQSDDPEKSSSVQIGRDANVIEAGGQKVTDLKRTARGLRFVMQGKVLPVSSAVHFRFQGLDRVAGLHAQDRRQGGREGQRVRLGERSGPSAPGPTATRPRGCGRRSTPRTPCSSIAGGRRTSPTCSASASTSRGTTRSRSPSSTRWSRPGSRRSPGCESPLPTSMNWFAKVRWRSEQFPSADGPAC